MATHVVAVKAVSLWIIDLKQKSGLPDTGLWMADGSPSLELNFC